MQCATSTLLSRSYHVFLIRIICNNIKCVRFLSVVTIPRIPPFLLPRVCIRYDHLPAGSHKDSQFRNCHLGGLRWSAAAASAMLAARRFTTHSSRLTFCRFQNINHQVTASGVVAAASWNTASCSTTAIACPRWALAPSSCRAAAAGNE